MQGDAPLKRFRDQTYYEILGVAANSSQRQLQAAFLKLDGMYKPGSLSLYSLLEAEEIEEIRAILRAARGTLLHEVSRRAYDRQLVEEGRLQPHELRNPVHAPASQEEQEPETAPLPQEEPPHEAAAPDPEEVSVPEPDFYDGAHLRAFREAKGIALENVALVTKVSRSTLQFIEEDRFDKLPAKVYLQGFLKAYAEVLGLNPEKTAASYLGRMGSV